MIGGGVPKNFTQDTVVCAEILGHEDVEVHKYAVQITVADVRDGACSSSTLQEAASWGKVSTALEQMVFAEATSVLPLLASRRLSSRPLEDPGEARLRQDVRLIIPPRLWPGRGPAVALAKAGARGSGRRGHHVAGNAEAFTPSYPSPCAARGGTALTPPHF